MIDDTEFLDNLHSFLKESRASPPNPSTNHGRETLHDDLSSSHIAEQVQWEVNDVDVDLFLIAYYVSGFIARHMLRAVRHDDCKTCLTAPVMLSTNAFIYFKEYKDDEQSLTYPSERLFETDSASVTVLDGMMADVVHTHSVEERITTAIKNTVDFGWIQSSSCSLHHQEIVDGIAWSVTKTSIPWWCKRKNRSLMEDGSKQAEGYKEEDENSFVHVSHLESNASLFSCIKSFFRLYG